MTKEEIKDFTNELIDNAYDITNRNSTEITEVKQTISNQFLNEWKEATTTVENYYPLYYMVIGNTMFLEGAFRNLTNTYQQLTLTNFDPGILERVISTYCVIREGTTLNNLYRAPITLNIPYNTMTLSGVIFQPQHQYLFLSSIIRLKPLE